MATSSGGVEIPKRKRGPYKQYLAPTQPGESVSLPKTTKWRRLLKDITNEENLNEEPSDELDYGAEEIGVLIPDDNPEESWNIYETSHTTGTTPG